MTTTQPLTRPTAAPVPRPATRRRHGRRILGAYAYLSPALILMIGLMLVPIGTVIYYSLINAAIVTRGRHIHFVGLDNYLTVLQDPAFTSSIGRTIVFAVVSVFFQMLLGMVFALLLNSESVGRGTRAVFRTMMIIPWLFSITIVVMLWRRLLLDPNGFVNYVLHLVGFPTEGYSWLGSTSTAMATVIFINVWAGYPFFMISLLAGLQGVPTELREAARVDGANAFQRFWNVTRPQIAPILVSMAVLDLIWNIQQFALIFLLTGGGPVGTTNVIAVYTYTSAFRAQTYSLASASAVIILLVSLVLAAVYMVTRRRLAR
jgi:multiple sugar transport system permease protein